METGSYARGGASLALLAAVACLDSGGVRAQGALSPGFERRTQPDEGGPRLQDPQFAPREAPRFELPPLPEPPAGGLASGPGVLVRRIEIVGNTVLDPDALRAIAAPYEGRQVTLEELFRLRDEISTAYFNEGYVNSGATLPDQQVVDGVVRLEIVEGELEAVDLAGTESLDPAFLERRIRLGADRPLNVERLQERLRLLLLDPSIQRLDARILPGSSAGQARLEVQVEEAERRLQVDLGVANDQSPSIGGTRAEVGFTYRNLLGRGDPLRLEVGASEGLREVEAGYAVPLTARDLRLHVEAEASTADIIDDEVDELDIESRSRSLTVGLSMPVYETVANRVGLDLSFVRERDRTFLLDEPFSFSAGTDEGQSDLSLVRFTQDWLNRGRRRAVSVASTFTLGLDVLGATSNDDEPDGQFLAWIGQAEVVQRVLTEEDQLALRGTLQLSEDPLLATEQFAAGGLGSVRGYRINEVVRDNGLALSVEYRWPILARLIPDPARRPEDASLELVPFIDGARAWNHDDSSTGDAETLLSVGLGLRGAIQPRLAAELYFGLPLVDRDGETEDPIQDAGIGFRLRFTPY